MNRTVSLPAGRARESARLTAFAGCDVSLSGAF